MKKSLAKTIPVKAEKKNKIKVYEKDFTLKDVLKADEAFVTGTFANIIPVKKINNRNINKIYKAIDYQ